MNAVAETTNNISEWIQTDERQYMRVRKDLGEAVYEFAEGIDLNDEVYGINAYTVNYNNFTEEQILAYIEDYDYESIEKVRELYGDDYKQIICECIFESLQFTDTSIYRDVDHEQVKALFKEYYGIDLMFDIDYEIELVTDYLVSLGHYKNIKFVEEVKGDGLYFNAINPEGKEVSIRAVVKDEVGVDEWNIYENSQQYDWKIIDGLYQ